MSEEGTEDPSSKRSARFATPIAGVIPIPVAKPAEGFVPSRAPAALPPGPSVLEIVKKSTEFLAGRGIDPARLNAEHLIGHALGLKRMQLYLQFERALSEPELAKIRPLVRRRGAGEPLQYVVGETDFHGVRLKVDRRALIPRPETEQLVEQAIGRLLTEPARILDLGTGSGAIALALAQKYPAAQVVATDASPEALALASENAAAAGFGARIQFVQSDWFAGLEGQEPFDLILSNPPYLTAAETAAAPAEVRNFEPLSALTGPDADGAGALRAILAGAGRWLSPGGWLALETGPDQHGGLLEAAASAGYVDAASVQDLSRRNRFIFAARPPRNPPAPAGFPPGQEASRSS